jgi:aminopeptidase N
VIAGEPEVAANWYPVNDHPLDKASYTFEVTVPAGLQVIANGRLEGHRTKAGNTTWTWEAREPMASYLATASVGHYALRSYQAGGLRFYDAVDPDLYSEPADPQDPGSPTFGDVVDESFSHQRRILTFLADRFGRYPFSTAGGSVDDYDGLFFALENQTRTVYSKYFFSDPISGDFVVVHENAHQWYGDSVSVARWKDVWLNEGFATYAEWLWSEDQGLGTAQENFDFFYNDYVPPDDPFWSIVVADPGVEHLFDDPIYFRGAMTLHVLRLAVGDRTFFQILRGWARHKAGGNGTTEQFIAFAEKISGQQLDQLFKDWLYTPGRPVLAGEGASGSRLQAPSAHVPAAAASELTRYRR